MQNKMTYSNHFFVYKIIFFSISLNIFTSSSIFKNSLSRITTKSNSIRDFTPRTLLIDNYDSYTYNIWHYLADVNKVEPIVVYNDEYISWENLRSTFSFDNIVISPGPGNPSVKADFGVCDDVIVNADVPIFGVCLGHQGIANMFGYKVGRLKY